VRRADTFVGSAWRATALYAILAIATTWPLVLHLTRSLPIDQGDSLLNCWILSWNADHLIAWFWGNTAAFQDYWSPPIYHPAPLALAYSEHLFAESLQIAPIYALTHNIFLCYNLLVLSTYVLSALGMYLLARELTGDARAAWVAGACYGFALVRLPQLTHLQVLSSQWMPFVLYGLRRYFTRLRADPLGWASVALVLQNLSCGYYLVFFAPFVMLYCLYEIADRRLWTSVRVWVSLAISAGLVGGVTWIFLKPYLMLRALGFEPRSLAELQSFSADVLAFMTAAPTSRLWGWLQTFPRGEGEQFPGLVTPLLAAIGIGTSWVSLARATALHTEPDPGRRRVTVVLLSLAAVYAAAGTLAAVTGDASWRVGGIRMALHDQWRVWGPAVLLASAGLVLSRRARAFVRGVPDSALGFFAGAALLAAVLATGPVPTVGGRETLLPSPYAQLYWHVPGYDGLRVPARHGMILALSLSVVAGYGARFLLRRGRPGRTAVATLALLFLAESTGAPIGLDQVLQSPGWGIPRAVGLGDDTPDVYRFVSTLPAGASLLELPFGTPAWDVQCLFYEQAHHRPIVNGYSGGSPSWYGAMTDALAVVGSNPALAWSALERSGASHVIVHRRGYLGRRAADRVEAFLSAHGARMIRASGDDRVYALPPS